jgi:hypothetical protein
MFCVADFKQDSRAQFVAFSVSLHCICAHVTLLKVEVLVDEGIIANQSSKSTRKFAGFKIICSTQLSHTRAILFRVFIVQQRGQEVDLSAETINLFSKIDIFPTIVRFVVLS